MNEYNEDVILLKRNMNAVAEGINRFEMLRQEDCRRVANLESQVAGLVRQIQDLTLSLAVLRATTIGRGPTK